MHDERQRHSRPARPVPARYTAPDGTERRVDAPVLALPRHHGVDLGGPVRGDHHPPARSADAVASAAVSGGGVLAGGGVVIGGIWMGVRAGLLRLNTARWAREWEQVEPQWSGRTR